MSDLHPVSSPPRPLGQSTTATVPGAPRVSTPPQVSKPKDDLSSLTLADDPQTTSGAPISNKIKITAYGVAGMTEKTYKRHANVTGTGAVHVKSFHGILSDEGLQRLDDKINDWLEGHTDLEVKFVTSNVGVWHGKTSEPALIVHVWH